MKVHSLVWKPGLSLLCVTQGTSLNLPEPASPTAWDDDAVGFLGVRVIAGDPGQPWASPWNRQLSSGGVSPAPRAHVPSGSSDHGGRTAHVPATLPERRPPWLTPLPHSPQAHPQPGCLHDLIYFIYKLVYCLIHHRSVTLRDWCIRGAPHT